MLLVLASPLVANDAEQGLARCAGIQNDAQRLACYDELARSAKGDTATGWRLSDAGDPGGLELAVLADREIQGHGVAYRPVLVFACPDDRFEACGLVVADDGIVERRR
jgi:hypothetical protein